MFSKETEYAIRSLVYICSQNSDGTHPGTDEIAREIEAPRFFTAKILQRLVRQGFVNSKKGKGGGFYFDRLQPALPIREIIVSIEGDSLLGGCGFGLKNCNEESPCPLHGSFAPIRSALNRVVSEQTIQSLAAGLQKPAPSA